MVFWLAPLALTTLGLVAVPILIHLLARQRSRRMLFPSLRFLPVAQFAALRRRAVADWPLLLVRVGMVVAAGVAAAAPVIVSDARREAWNARVARAIVVTGQSRDVQRVADDEAAQSFASYQFNASRLPDAVRAAVDWLATQPPAARELVVAGDVRHGALSRADLDVVPDHVGIRFLPITSPDDGSRVEAYAVAESDRRIGTYRLQVVPLSSETRVDFSESDRDQPPSVRVVAAPPQQAHADALLRAVLREGVWLSDAEGRQITIAFSGARIDGATSMRPASGWMREVIERNPAVRGGDAGGRLVLHVPMEVIDSRAPRIVADVFDSAFTPDFATSEPRRIAAATLAAWSRPHRGAPADALPADEGDRRWLWAAALLLLGVEQLLRRRRRNG